MTPEQQRVVKAAHDAKHARERLHADITALQARLEPKRIVRNMRDELKGRREQATKAAILHPGAVATGAGILGGAILLRLFLKRRATVIKPASSYPGYAHPSERS